MNPMPRMLEIFGARPKSAGSALVMVLALLAFNVWADMQKQHVGAPPAGETPPAVITPADGSTPAGEDLTSNWPAFGASVTLLFTLLLGEWGQPRKVE